MKSKSSAPGKVILFGEHFVVYGIQAILCAINKRVYVTAEKTNDNTISIMSDIGNLCILSHTPISEIDSPLKPLYYLADKMIQDQGNNINNNNNNNGDNDDDNDDDANTGIRITVESEIPLGVGLGSSSACCVAGAAAISRLFKQTSREEILQLAIQAERTIFENTSGADCTVCTYGGIITYDKEHGFEHISPKSTFNLVIANSNLQHSTESIVANVRKFKDDNPVSFSRLCDDEAKLVRDVLQLLQTGNNDGDSNNDNSNDNSNDNNNDTSISELGEHIKRNQEYLEAIGVSNDTLRDMVKIGQTASFGAKLTGAGGGGCVFALTDHSNIQCTINQFQDGNYNCFSVDIDFKGLDTF